MCFPVTLFPSCFFRKACCKYILPSIPLLSPHLFASSVASSPLLPHIQADFFHFLDPSKHMLVQRSYFQSATVPTYNLYGGPKPVSLLYMSMSTATCHLLSMVVGAPSQALFTFHIHIILPIEKLFKIQQLSLLRSQAFSRFGLLTFALL